jgi:hypothetical protein
MWNMRVTTVFPSLEQKTAGHDNLPLGKESAEVELLPPKREDIAIVVVVVVVLFFLIKKRKEREGTAIVRDSCHLVLGRIRIKIEIERASRSST